jgi:hypothetical protein
MKFNRVLALLICTGMVTPAITAGTMCEKSGMMCEKSGMVKLKDWSFKNGTDRLLELDLKFPQDGKAIVVLPIKDLQNPNFFSSTFKYTNMEDPVLIIKHSGKPVPFTVFKGNYSTATKNQVRAQCPAGHYKIISNPYKVGFHLLLLDESVNVEDIKDKL